MTELEEARARKAELYRAVKRAREGALDARDGAQRRRLLEQERILRQMYKEACERARRLEGGGAGRGERAGKNGRKPPSRLETVTACGAVWSDLEGTRWSRLEGTGFDALARPETGGQLRRAAELVRGACAACTPRQLECLNAYYGEELTLEEIAGRLGVKPSTVSRCLARARRNLERHIAARLLLGRCVDGGGKFDYMKFLHSARVLSERQKELVYLLLARDTSYRDIAEYLERAASTVERTAERAQRKLEQLHVAVDAGVSAVRVERRDWSGRSEKELAEDLGLTPAFYYRVVRRGECVDGTPLLHCAVLRRLARGESAQDAARALGCSREYVRRVGRLYAGKPCPAFTEDYKPKAQRLARVPENPFAALGDAVIDRIDAETYRKLQERFGEP